MTLEQLLDGFIGKTNSQVDETVGEFLINNALQDLISRLKQKLLEMGENDKSEKISLSDCGFCNHKAELEELLEEDFINLSGLPIALLTKGKCGCEEHWDSNWFGIPHSQNGYVWDEKINEMVDGPMAQEEFDDSIYDDHNMVYFRPCGHTKEELEEIFSGNEKYYAAKLAVSCPDWCVYLSRRKRGDGSGGGSINQIPGFMGNTCYPELRVIIPLESVKTWIRLEKTARQLNLCPNTQTVGFVIGDNENGTGDKFKRVWKQFIDAGNISQLSLLSVGMIVANGNNSETIQRWNGVKWS